MLGGRTGHKEREKERERERERESERWKGWSITALHNSVLLLVVSNDLYISLILDKHMKIRMKFQLHFFCKLTKKINTKMVSL